MKGRKIVYDRGIFVLTHNDTPIYVGLSDDVYRGKEYHIDKLLEGELHEVYTHKVIKKYDPKHLTFIIIKIFPGTFTEERIQEEKQEWIDKLKPILNVKMASMSKPHIIRIMGELDENQTQDFIPMEHDAKLPVGIRQMYIKTPSFGVKCIIEKDEWYNYYILHP